MFEIGNKVVYQGADKSAYKREGTVKSIEDKDGKPQLTVELDGGETFTAPIDDWSRKFNNAATHVSTNSVVANALAANRRVVRNDAYSDYMRFCNKWRGVVADMERKLQSCKREAPSDATLVVSGQIDDAITEVHAVAQWLENTRYLSREDFEF